jgi:hypothetical protein
MPPRPTAHPSKTGDEFEVEFVPDVDPRFLPFRIPITIKSGLAPIESTAEGGCSIKFALIRDE